MKTLLRKWPHLWLTHARWRHSCVFDGALLGQFPPVRQGAPVLRRGQSSAVGLFLFPQLVCALSTSALRAERRPRTRLRISIGIGARPTSRRDGEVLVESRSKHRRPRQRRESKGKSLPRSGGRIKLTKAASSPPASLIVDERILAFLSFVLALFACCQTAAWAVHGAAERTWLFTGCWASLRRWSRFITGRFSVSRCGQLLLRSPLLPPLPDMSYYRLCGQLLISLCG